MNKQLRIEKLSESKLKFLAPREILEDISDMLRFEVPNAKHQPKVKAGIWDGYIRPLSEYNGIAPLGLAERIAEMAETLGHETVLSDDFAADDRIPEDIAYKIAKKVGSTLEPRPYQALGVYEALRHRRRLILSATGSGKSFVLFLLHHFFMKSKKKTLLIFPRLSLVKQIIGDFEDYQGHSNGVEILGKSKNSDAMVQITTWQTAVRQSKEWLAQFDAVVVDEAHDAKAKSLSYIMENMTNAVYRIGMTGTTDEEESNEITLEGHFGGRSVVSETHELIEQGVLAELTIEALHVRYDEDTVAGAARLRNNFAAEKEFVIGMEARNKFITGLAASTKGNVLILVERIDHIEKLEKMLRRSTNRPILLFHGGISVENRDRARKEMEELDDAILIASFASFAVGSNVKKIDKLIFAINFKSRIRVLQSIGRVLRKGNGSVSATVYDLIDDLKPSSGRENHLLRHGKRRIEMYTKEKLKWKSRQLFIKAS